MKTCIVWTLALVCYALPCEAQSATPSPSPTATPALFSEQTLADLKRLQEAALSSDYAYRQVAHLADNIGPRLTGSAQAAKAVDYVASELKAIGCAVKKPPRWCNGLDRPKTRPKRLCSARLVEAWRRRPKELLRLSSP